MELDADKHTHRKFDASHKIAAQGVDIIQKHGVSWRALQGDVIGFCTQLIISGAELDDMFARIHAAMRAVAERAKTLR